MLQLRLGWFEGICFTFRYEPCRLVRRIAERLCLAVATTAERNGRSTSKVVLVAVHIIYFKITFYTKRSIVPNGYSGRHMSSLISVAKNRVIFVYQQIEAESKTDYSPLGASSVEKSHPLCRDVVLRRARDSRSADNRAVIRSEASEPPILASLSTFS